MQHLPTSEDLHRSPKIPANILPRGRRRKGPREAVHRGRRSFSFGSRRSPLRGHLDFYVRRTNHGRFTGQYDIVGASCCSMNSSISRLPSDHLRKAQYGDHNLSFEDTECLEFGSFYYLCLITIRSISIFILIVIILFCILNF